MQFDPSSVEIDEGVGYKRGSCCIALCGPPEVSIQWAVAAMEIQHPPNATRTLLCYPNLSLDLSRNVTLSEWKKAVGVLETEWIALLAAESPIRWDAVAVTTVKGDRRTKIGEAYVFHRSALETTEGPWFVNNEFVHGQCVDRSDLCDADGSKLVGGILPQVSEEAAPQLIVTCVPSLGKTSLMWLAHAIQLASPVASTSALMVALGREVGDARQTLAEMVLRMSPRPAYMFFYGDDNIPPPTGLRMLYDTIHQTGHEAVAGVYHIKQRPPDLPLMWRNGQPGLLMPGRDFEPDDIVEVDGTGLDFCLIRVDALAKMPFLKFKTVVEWIEGKGMRCQTEDAFFWDRFRETFGHGPLVDTRCRVGHYSSHDGGIY